MLAIVSDSNSGISPTEALMLNVKIIPMPVVINQKTYYEGFDLDNATFYKYLASDNSIHTTKPLVKDLIDCFDDCFNKGVDEILYIPMSSGLSSSYETSKILNEEYGSKVYVVDNHRISVTLKSSVLDACILRNKGYQASEIKTILEKNAYDSFILVLVDDTKMLLKGGRSKGLEAFCSTLHIKPILKIEGEKLELYKKCRGYKQTSRYLIEKIKEKALEYDRLGIEYRIGYASSVNDSELLKELGDYLKETFPNIDLYYDPLTYSISSHVGANAFGVGIAAKANY